MLRDLFEGTRLDLRPSPPGLLRRLLVAGVVLAAKLLSLFDKPRLETTQFSRISATLRSTIGARRFLRDFAEIQAFHLSSVSHGLGFEVDVIQQCRHASVRPNID